MSVRLTGDLDLQSDWPSNCKVRDAYRLLPAHYTLDYSSTAPSPLPRNRRRLQMSHAYTVAFVRILPSSLYKPSARASRHGPL